MPNVISNGGAAQLTLIVVVELVTTVTFCGGAPGTKNRMIL